MRKLLPLAILLVGLGGAAALVMSKPEREPLSVEERTWIVSVQRMALLARIDSMWSRFSRTFQRPATTRTATAPISSPIPMRNARRPIRGGRAGFEKRENALTQGPWVKLDSKRCRSSKLLRVNESSSRALASSVRWRTGSLLAKSAANSGSVKVRSRARGSLTY